MVAAVDRRSKQLCTPDLSSSSKNGGGVRLAVLLIKRASITLSMEDSLCSSPGVYRKSTAELVGSAMILHFVH